MPPRTFLFDNGSLRPASTLNLRCLAAGLAGRVGEVEPVSLLHSSGIDPSRLLGQPARLLEPAVLQSLEQDPDRPLLLLPLFFGPSAALTQYVPDRLAAVRARFPTAKIQLAEPLCPNPAQPEPLLVQALARLARKAIAEKGLHRPAVVLVDHGSPQPAVTQVRDTLAQALGVALGQDVTGVFPSSMERREGPEYAFNDPLLAARLRTPPTASGDVVLVLQFLSPGRHAGPEGDIAAICAEAQAASGGALRVHVTDTVGLEHEIIDLLEIRWRRAVGA